MKQSSNLIR